MSDELRAFLDYMAIDTKPGDFTPPVQFGGNSSFRSFKSGGQPKG